MRKSTGFTMIELLVVFGIIGLLMAILVPAVSTIREQGRRISCASNLHEIALAVMTYARDHRYSMPVAPLYDSKGHYMSLTQPGYARNCPNYWHPVLVRMMAQYGVPIKELTCPDNQDFGNPPIIDTNPTSATSGEYLCNYVYLPGLEDPSVNDGVDVRFYEKATSVPKLQGVLSGDGSKIILADMNMWWDSLHELRSNHANAGKIDNIADLATAVKLLQGSNRCYADGRVEWVGPDQMGNEGAPPDGNAMSSRYSHYLDLRPYYW